MSGEEILAYAKKIRPLVRGKKPINSFLSPENRINPLYWAKAECIASESFTFSAGEALMPAQGLVEVGRITTWHRYGGHRAFLRPSVDEAIVQCPKEWLDKVIAFEFQTDSLDFEKVYNSALDRHVLTTIYYTGTLPEEIAKLPVKW